MPLRPDAIGALLDTRWLGRELDVRGVVESTNDEAAALGRAGARHGTVVLAEGQTRGRGRQGRAWHSPVGDNLYLSALLRLPLPPAAAPPLTLAAGVALHDALKDLGAAPSIKWPNDLLIEGKKVAGILTETSTRGERMELVVVGVGLNVNQTQFPDDLAGLATSLALALGRALDRDEVCARVLGRLEAWVDRFVADGAAAIAAAWRERSDLLGRRVRVAVEGRLVEGRAADVDAEGALWVQDDDGRRWRVLSGEVSPVPLLREVHR